MVVSPAAGRPGARAGGRPLDPRLRVALWAAMAAAVFWTLVYQRARDDSGIPEFVYVNF